MCQVFKKKKKAVVSGLSPEVMNLWQHLYMAVFLNFCTVLPCRSPSGAGYWAAWACLSDPIWGIYLLVDDAECQIISKQLRHLFQAVPEGLRRYC